MKAEDLRLRELVGFREGELSLHGRRLILHDIRAFGQFRRDVLEMVGPEQARRMLTRFGYFWGQEDAAAMNRIFRWANLIEWLKCGPRLQTLQGVHTSVLKSLKVDEEAGKFQMEVVWYDSAEAEEYPSEEGESDEPMCWIQVGYASGYASYCMGRSVFFIEKKCRGKGDKVCLAVGKDRASWGEELKPHLPYFMSDDIKGKVQKLTSELRKKSKELSKHRRLLGLPTRGEKPFSIEVRSKAYQRVIDLANRVARFDSSILITGETGVGKEVIGRYIARLSHRSDGPFLPVNCGALPETLLESELFGHKAGSFTGAIKDRIGLFEQASKGTIFLDEIGDITPAMQLKILRVLQEKEVLRVGESKPRKVDVRIISATNRDLVQLMAEGKFREDLYYRLRVIEIEIPPLRERQEDILPLARFFVKQMSQKLRISGLELDATCLDYILAYPWPGNVRELENAIERAAVLSKDGLILPENLPPNVVNLSLARPGAANPLSRTLDEVEMEHINNVLRSVGDNRTKAAAVLGISPATLWRKLKRGEEEDDLGVAP